MPEYKYSKPNEPTKLAREIEAGLGKKITGVDQVGYLRTVGDDIFVVFETALTPDEKTTLDAIIEAHVAKVARYEAYKEFTHPKLKGILRRDIEILEFDEELTPDELSTLETQLKKKIRKIE